MIEEMFMSFLGVCLVLGAVLILFYYRMQPNSAHKRACAFIVLLIGEMFLFPWTSLVDWLRVAVIALVNYVVGTDRATLDGIGEAIKDFLLRFRKPPRSGGESGQMVEHLDSTAPTSDQAASKSDELMSVSQELSVFIFLRRMFWPDLSVK
jgi:hypothetical protein